MRLLCFVGFGVRLTSMKRTGRPRQTFARDTAMRMLVHAGFESQVAFEDWHLRRPLNSGRNMKIVAAEGAKPRGPFGAVEQVEWSGVSRL